MTLLVLGSSNRHKLEELARVLGRAAPGIDVVPASAFGPIPEVDEHGATFTENARIKVRAFDAWLCHVGAPASRYVLADDSGLCVDALGGAPGVCSARYAGAGATDADNNRRLSTELRARGLEGASAHYACVLALLDRTGQTASGSEPAISCFEGRMDVTVRPEGRGRGGFGYDPHAYLPDGRTVAELSPDEKDRRGHRGRALRKLATFLAAAGRRDPA